LLSNSASVTYACQRQWTLSGLKARSAVAQNVARTSADGLTCQKLLFRVSNKYTRVLVSLPWALHRVFGHESGLFFLFVCLGLITSASLPNALAERKEGAYTPIGSGNQASDPTTGTEGKIDLNGATEKELQQLPGIGPVLAKKIIAGRPYSSVADLSKAAIPQKAIEKITPRAMCSSSAR